MLCHILQKLDENTLLDEIEVKFLKAEGLTDTLKIVQKMEFSALKVKYHATQIQEDDISHHLFKVLKKLDTGLSLPEPDINYLKKRKLFETVKFVYKKEADSLNRKIEQGHGLRPDDITWCEEHDFKDIIFKWLKNDYGVNYRPDTPDSCLYIILRKLESSNRLTDEEVVWLEGENLLRPEKEIYLAHHTLEARFYENEFQRTKGHWSLVNASAHWRKAEKPQQALKQTNNLNFKQIKPAKLAAALLTTRGGALRDIDHLSEAEQCALEAIKYFPNSHNPYTLMGALCYDTGRYDEGDRWFEEAVKRGAKPQDQDAEIKRILHKKKESECKELISHLLKKDSSRFAWLRTWKVGKR
jgi:tetratricopeptide (TPR) repeat protein